MADPDETFPDPPVQNKGGRPPKMDTSPQTLQQLAGLGSIQATKPEVAAVFNVTMPTLRIYFKANPEALAAYENGKGIGKMSLRRRQWKMAEKNPTMAIWLGKNWLDQSDRAKHEHTGKGGGPIAVVDPAALAALSDEELEAYERLCIKLGTAVSTGDAGGDPGGEGPEACGEEPI